MSPQKGCLAKRFLTAVQLDDLGMDTNDFNNGSTTDLNPHGAL